MFLKFIKLLKTLCYICSKGFQHIWSSIGRILFKKVRSPKVHWKLLWIYSKYRVYVGYITVCIIMQCKRHHLINIVMVSLCSNNLELEYDRPLLHCNACMRSAIVDHLAICSLALAPVVTLDLLVYLLLVYSFILLAVSRYL